VLPHADARVGGSQVDPDRRTFALARHCCRCWVCSTVVVVVVVVVEAAALGFWEDWRIVRLGRRTAGVYSVRGGALEGSGGGVCERWVVIGR
jgi:hypothetical protein